MERDSGLFTGSNTGGGIILILLLPASHDWLNSIEGIQDLLHMWME